MHLDEEQVQRVLHRESIASDVRDHAGACAECQSRLAVAEREEHEVFDLLRHLDHAPLAIPLGSIVQRATPSTGHMMRWAAGLVVAAGLAGVAWAAPGSPLKAWVRSVITRPAPVPVVAQETPPAPPPEPAMGGIAVVPGPRLRIAFSRQQRAGAVTITLVDDAEVVVQGPSAAATWSEGEGRILVNNHGDSASFAISIPRAARQVEVTVAGVRIFLKSGLRITTDAAAGATGQYVLPLGSR